MLADAYGGGVDSTALLVGQVKRGIRPDYILFADTGSEKPETYDYLLLMQEFLLREGFPPITIVWRVVTDFKWWPPYHTLEQNCLTNGTLPSIAFNYQRSTCSEVWKQGPQHKWLKQQADVQALWKDGRRLKVFPDDRKILKVIGYDNSPNDKKRTYKVKNKVDKHYTFSYPLIDWGWDRQRCMEEIRSVGLPVPLKSACFFCPSSQTWEIRALPADLLRRIVIMEARAKPRLTSIEGLWANGRKGTRGGERKPGSMTQFIREEGLLPSDHIDWIIETIPGELISRNEQHKLGHAILSWEDYFVDLDSRAPWREAA